MVMRKPELPKMAVRGALSKLSLFLTILLLMSYFSDFNVKENLSNDVPSIFVHLKLDIYLSTESKPSNLRRRYKETTSLEPCLKVKAGIRLTKLFLWSGCFLLLAGDVSLNPGPVSVTDTGLFCPTCSKIIRRNQSCLQCQLCKFKFHLQCLSGDFEISGNCRRCFDYPSVTAEAVNVSADGSELNILPNLKEVLKLRGFKMFHQNIQSLKSKIDQLRLIMQELKQGVHLLAITETWANKEILDSELDIPGYRLFRRDRGSKGGGIAVYVKKEILVTRRGDLEDSSVEGLWLEITMPKSRGFLVGSFYRPPSSSSYHDKDFMVKLDNVLGNAVSEGKEVLILELLNSRLCLMHQLLTRGNYVLSALMGFLMFQVYVPSVGN